MDPILEPWTVRGDGGYGSLPQCLRAGGRIPMEIKDKDWTFEALYLAAQMARDQPSRKVDWEKYVFVFDPEKVGFGEYGWERPVAMISHKWDGSVGMIQLKRDGMKFKRPDYLGMQDFVVHVSCMPRSNNYTDAVVLHFLEEATVCNRCVKVAEPFEVLENGKTYCLACVNKFYPECCNICNNRYTGETALKIYLGGEIYTCGACRDFMRHRIP